MKNLFDVIENTGSTVAQITALKAVVNGCLSRIIYGISNNVSYRERETRQEQTNDRRNQMDADYGRENAITRDFGFEERVDPMVRIHALTNIWFIAQERIHTLGVSEFNRPMTPESMLNLFLDSAPAVDKTVLTMLAEAMDADVEDLVKVKEMQIANDREQLLRAVPEIKLHFAGATSGERLGFVPDWSEVIAGDIFDTVSILDQHQLAVKAVEMCKKAKDRVMINVMRTNKISEIGDMKLLTQGLVTISDFVRQLERNNSSEFAQLIEDGRSFKTLADV